LKEYKNMSWFDIENIAVEIWSYKLSYIELIGVITGFLSVLFATRAQILTWPIGIINIICFVSLFYQTQLYPDMFLQLYYFIVTIYGWLHWRSKTKPVSIAWLSPETRLKAIFVIAAGTILSGLFFSHIHQILPLYFEKPSAFAYADSFVMVCSISAMKLMADKKTENWLLWMAVNVVCTFLYFQKSLYFLAIEYFIFFLLAMYGYFFWQQKIHEQSSK
jgi:nicotinamide mononucleotide transporter